ncbi:MAG: DUF2029 domain-containing protein [Candidatus Methanoplasma sp.]|nr:DUF2029 domain-containing protein [Candidatus Methanoplasma sp.]
MRTTDNRNRYQLVLGLMFVAASAIFILAVHYFGLETEVVRGYFPYADELMRGSMPETEYPPFALVFFALPRLFADTAFGYNIMFVAEAVVFFIIGLVVTGKLAKRYNHSPNKAMLIYTIFMLLMLEFVVDRYDIFPVVLTLLSFYCFVTKRYVWAFVLLSIATMTKLYPAVLFPIYLIPFVMNRDWPNALKGTCVFILVAALIVLPFALLWPDAGFSFLTYHMDRPLHLESVAASFIHLTSVFGLNDVSIAFSYGSDNLIGPWPDTVASYLTPLMLMSLFLVYAFYTYRLSISRKEKYDNENSRMVLLGWAALLSLLAFITIGKVFSTQYIVWMIPFIVFMQMTTIDHVVKNNILVLSVIVIILSQLNFAVNVGLCGGGENVTDAGMMILLARNILVILLFAYVIWACKKGIYRKLWPGRSADT